MIFAYHGVLFSFSARNTAGISVFSFFARSVNLLIIFTHLRILIWDFLLIYRDDLMSEALAIINVVFIQNFGVGVTERCDTARLAHKSGIFVAKNLFDVR